MTPFLRFVDVHKRFGGREVLRGVTLDVPAGIIPVTARGDVWTLEAKAPTHRSPAATRALTNALCTAFRLPVMARV